MSDKVSEVSELDQGRETRPWGYWPWDDMLIGKWIVIDLESLGDLSVSSFRTMARQAGERRPHVERVTVRQQGSEVWLKGFVREPEEEMQVSASGEPDPKNESPIRQVGG